MPSSKPFPCTKCSACCRRVTALYPDWPTREDGACIALKADNTCGVYETRPAVCRIDDALPKGMTVTDWHRANAKACNAMQAEDGLPAALRVSVD